MPRSPQILVGPRNCGQNSLRRCSQQSPSTPVWWFLLSAFALLRLDCVKTEFLTSPAVAWTYDLPSEVSGGSNQPDGNNQQQRPQREERSQDTLQRRRLQQRQQDNSLGARFGRGNAVTVSSDGSQLYITESNGALHIVNTGVVVAGSDEDTKRAPLTYIPEATTTGGGNTDNDSTSSVGSLTCSGGVAIYRDAVVVYAVTDHIASVNGNDGDSDATSRILGVDPRTGNFTWSVALGGTVVGTPWISGRHMYVVRNTATSGYVTVLELAQDGSDAEVVATVPDPAASGEALGWLGPLAGHTVTIDGAERDVVVVALATNPSASSDAIGSDNGGGGAGPNNQDSGNSDSQGSLYAVVPSADYDNLQAKTADAYAIRIVSSYPLLTDLRPAFDGARIYLAHQGRLSGWDGTDQDLSSVWDGTNQDRAPSWETRRSDEDGSVYPCAPVLSPDSTLLLVSTPTPGLSCRDIAGSTTVWSDSFNDVSVAEPFVSAIPGASESVVYLVQQTSGVVRQYGLTDGALNWEVDCTTVTGDNNCDLNVLADISTSSNGNILYYVLESGTLVALKVAEFATSPPTIFPTAPPSRATIPGASPSRALTPSPSLRGSSVATDDNGSSVTDSESTQSNSSPFTLPVILGAAAGGLLILIALVSLFLCRRKHSRTGKADQERIAKEREALRKWNEEKAAYERACKEQEEETLEDISASSILAKAPEPASPSVDTTSTSTGHRKRGSSASRTRTAPVPLDSITEDADFEDDGSEAGIEVSIGNLSEDHLAMSDDESPKKEAANEGTAVASVLVSRSDSGDPQGVCELGNESVSNNEDMAPIVRNLDSSFSEVSDIPSSPPSDNVTHENTSLASKPDPEPTGAANSGCSESKKSAHIQLLQAVQDSRKTKNGDSSVFSGTTADGDPVIYRPEDDIVRASSKPDDFSDNRGRPTSPDFSDVWSADGSLYLDEESNAARDRSIVAPVQPEDEPGMISKGCRPKSPDPLIRPVSQWPQNTNPSPSRAKSLMLASTSPKPVPKFPRTPPAAQKVLDRQAISKKLVAAAPCASSAPESALSEVMQPVGAKSLSTSLPSGKEGKSTTRNVPPPRPQSRVSPQVRGGSARPRAGLFTRRENPLVSSSGNSSDSGSETMPKGYMPEREARAAYIPSVFNHPDHVLNTAAQSNASLSKASHQANPSSNQKLRADQLKSSEQPPPRRSSLRNPSRGSTSLTAMKSSSESRLRPATARPKSSPSLDPESPQPKTGAYAAWDSFLSELAKVEETFFNPKLGASKAGTTKGGRRRQQHHTRRSRSVDDYSDSDSDSSFSAGLNPMG